MDKGENVDVVSFTTEHPETRPNGGSAIVGSIHNQ